MSTTKWLEKIAPDATVNALATHSGIYTSTLDKQLKKGKLTAEVVIKIARAYSAPVLEGLVACGIITEDEAQLRERMDKLEALAEATDQELLEEFLRRVDTDGRLQHPLFGAPLGDLPEKNEVNEDAEVYKLAAFTPGAQIVDGYDQIHPED